MAALYFGTKQSPQLKDERSVGGQFCCAEESPSSAAAATLPALASKGTRGGEATDPFSFRVRILMI